MFDATISAATLATAAANGGFSTGALTVGLVSFANNLNGAVTLNTTGTNTVTLGGNAGDVIDMTQANQDVTWNGTGYLRLGAVTGQQNFDVAAGRTLTINVANLYSKGNSDTLGLIGGGNIVINSYVYGTTTPIGLNINGANVTLSNSNSWNPNTSTTFALTSGALNFANDNAVQTATGNTKSFSILGGTISASGAAHSVVTNGGFGIGGSFAAGGTNNLTLNSSAFVTTNATITNNMTGGAVFTIGGGLDLTASGTTNRTLTFAGAANSAISGVVSNGASTGVGSLTYAGTGTLSLSNANTFSGTLAVTSGAVQLLNALAAQNATVSVGVNNGVAFGTGITAFTVGALSGSSNLALTNADANAVSLTVGNNNTTGQSYGGILSGGGSLTKIGTGVQTLTAAGQTYGGATSVTGGTLQFNAGGAATISNLLGARALSLSGGGTARFQSSSGVTFNNALALGAGGGGTLSFRANSYFQPTAISGAGALTLSLDNGVTLTPNSFQSWNGTINVVTTGTAATFRLDGAFDNSSMLNAVLNLGAGIAQTRNAGTNNAITTDIGTLAGAAGSSLGGSNAGTGTFTFSVGSRNENSTFAGTIVDGGTKTALTKVGTGTLTLTATNTFTGNTTITLGTLEDDGALGNTAVTVASGGTLAGSGAVGNTGANAVSVSGTVAPGNPATIATLTTGLQTWLGGGTYTWKLGNAAPASGAGWDQISMGTFALDPSTSSTPFTIKATTLSSGQVANFNAANPYTWIIAHSGDVNFASLSASNFVLNTTALNSALGTTSGQYALAGVMDPTSGSDLEIVYTPAPEPAGLALLSLGASALLTRRRRTTQRRV